MRARNGICGAAMAFGVLLLTAGAALAATSWTIVSSPNKAPVLPETLAGVSCTSATFCMAVGQYAEVPPPSNPADQTLIEEWDGASWSIVPSPSPSQLGPSQPQPGNVGNYLGGVSCTSTTFCVAVGYEYTSTQPVTLVEQWDGNAWTLVTAPNPSSSGDFLAGVSCMSTSFCMAVGYQLVGAVYQTLAEAWNGNAWSVASSPNTASTEENTFNSVSCTSSSFCMADGWSCNSNYSACPALIATWDGAHWSMSSAANTAATYNYLYAVSCASASFCAAAGSTFQPSTSGPGTISSLIETWSGSAWTAVALPAATAQNRPLYGIDCPDAGSCVAAGNDENGSTAQTLIDQWDGSAWTTATSPDASAPGGAATSNALWNIGCASSEFCVAVGAYNLVSTPITAISQTLIEQSQGQAPVGVPEAPWIPGFALASLAPLAVVSLRRRGRRSV